MSTRYDEITKILGTDSAGTPSPTPAEEEQKQTSRRDELYSLLGASEPEAPATSDTRASTTQSSPVLEKPKQETLQQTTPQQTTPQTATPSTSSGAYAPPSPQGEGRSTGQVQQGERTAQAETAQITQSQAQAELDRLKPVLEEAKQYENEMGRYRSGAGQDESLYLRALTKRDSLLKKYGYSSVDELNKAVMDYTLASGNELSFMQKMDRAGYAMDESLKNTVLSGDWWKKVLSGGAEQWAGSQLNAAGTTAGNIESIGKEGTGMVYENELRARNDWATTLEEAKSGVIQMDAEGIKEIENIIAYYDNTLLPSLRSGVQAYETLAEDSAQAADEITAKGQQNTEKAKEGLGWGGQLAVDLLTQGTMVALDKATGAPNISMFTRGLGSGAQEARQSGGTAQEQIGYGAAVGTVEVLTNKLFDGLAGIYGKGAADDLVEATIAKLAKSRAGQASLRLLASGFNEGIEEILSDAINPLLRTIYSDKSIKEEYSEEKISQWLYDGLVGAIMGTGLTAVNPETYALNTGNTQTGGQEQTGAETQAEEMADTGATPQSAALTAPLAEEPFRAGTQGRPYSQTGQMNTPQETQTQAAGAAQNVQRATPQAETPPTTENAEQAAYDALNRQVEMNAQEQEVAATQTAAPDAYNRATAQAPQSVAGGVATSGGGTATGESGSVLPYGAKLSRFWENTLQKTENSANAPESVKNPLWYMPKSEVQSLAEAASRLDADKQGTIENLVSAEAWSGVQLDAAAAVSDTLYAEGAATGDYSSYAAWRKVMQNHVTDTARGIQALAKYTRTGKGIAMDGVAKIQDSSLNPEQKTDAQKTVVQFGNDLDNAINNKDIAGMRELILKMNEQRGTGTFVKGNFEKVLGKIEDAKYLSEYAKRQLDAVATDFTVSETRSLGEVLKTWQVNAQLTSLGTFLRNIGGNLSFGAIDSVSQNGFALALDHLVSKKTGKRTVAADKGWFSSEARKQTGDAFYRSILEVAGDVDMGGSDTRYGITSGRTFKMSGGKAERFMSRWEQLLGYSLRTSDQASRGQIEGSVRSGLEGIENSGLSAEEISRIAESTADYRLFQNEGTAAKLSKGLHDVFNLVGIGGQVNGVTRQGGFGIGDLVNPYPKVPANLAVKALEYSPANIIKGGIELVKLLKTVNAPKATAQTKAQSGGPGQIAPGTVVRALYRGNYGYVQSFDGSTYSVKFTSKDGLSATKRFTPDQIEATNAKTIEEAKRGGKSAGKALDQHQAVMDIARGMTGVPIIALCAALFKSGLVKNFDDEEDYDVMAQNAAEGKTGVQINLDAALRAFNGESTEWKDGDDLMSISWAEPINAFLAIGSLIANEDDDATIGTYIGDYFSGALQSVLDMPLMSHLSGTIDTVRYSTAESLGGQMAEGALDYATSTATGFVPAPMRQAARAIDPYYRNTTGDSALETAWNKLANVIPGLRQLALDAKTDNFGQPKENTGGFARRALNALVLPGAINELNQSEASAAVEAIYEATGDAGVYPDRKAPNSISYREKKHSLTSEEKQEYQTEAGQTSRDLISALSGSQYYGNLSDEQKAEVVKTINQYAEHKAADKIFDILGVDTKRDKWESLEGDDLINYLTVKVLAKGIYDDNGKITDYSAMDKLIGGAYSSLSENAKEIISGSYSMLDELSYGKEHGVDSKTVMTAKEMADTNGSGSISQEELWYYLGLQKNMPTSTKSELWDILTTGKTGYSQYAEKQK